MAAALKSAIQVHEVWALRNGSTATITVRLGAIASGTIDDSDAIHTWIAGRDKAGIGYDLVRQVQ